MTPEDLRRTLSYKRKSDFWTNKDIRTLQKNIREIYNGIDKTTLCTRGRSAHHVARELAKISFLGEYKEVDIGNQLKKFSKGKLANKPRG